jgi:cell division FtsZ-interacting protein ZapD
MNNTQTIDFEIWEINHRLQSLTLLTEGGFLFLSYLYDTHQEWVEIAEGGYVVESGLEYQAINIQIKEVQDESGAPVDISGDEQILKIIKYIKNETESELNGWH